MPNKASTQETPCCATECHKPSKPWTKVQLAVFIGTMVAVAATGLGFLAWTQHLDHEAEMAWIAAGIPAGDAITDEAAQNVFLSSAIVSCGLILALIVWLVGTTIRHRLTEGKPERCDCSKQRKELRVGPVRVTQ